MINNRVKYIYSEDFGMELIFCKNSKISYPIHNHVSVFTMGMVLDGSILLDLNSVREVYAKNRTFFIPPYMPHSISANDGYSLLTLCIDKNLAKKCTGDMIKIKTAGFLDKVLDIVEIEESQTDELLSRLTAFSDFSYWGSRDEKSLINKLKDTLEMYPEIKHSVDEMAGNAFVSKYHFIRKFKSGVGLTPHQFQIQNRIRKARHLLSESETVTVTEVALAAGFCDQSHFIKHFEKYLGLTPLDFKSSVIKMKSESDTP